MVRSAALVARLALVAQQSRCWPGNAAGATLVARLALVAELARWLVGCCRTGAQYRKQLGGRAGDPSYGD